MKKTALFFLMLITGLAALGAQSIAEMQEASALPVSEPVAVTAGLPAEPAEPEPAEPAATTPVYNNALSLAGHYGIQFVQVKAGTLGASDYGLGAALTYRRDFTKTFAASVEGDFSAYRYTKYGYSKPYLTADFLLFANFKLGDHVLLAAGGGADFRTYDRMGGFFPALGINAAWVHDLGQRMFLEAGVKGRVVFQLVKDDSYGSEVDLAVKAFLGAGVRF